MELDLKLIHNNIQNNEYENIGNGSGRSVYDIGEGYVAKYARNIRGVAQNYTEYEIFMRSYSRILAEIYKISCNNNLLIMQKAKPLDNIDTLLKYFNVKSKDELVYVDIIRYLVNKYKLMPADLCKPGSWGTVNNRLVLIDYGFTRWVSKQFYSKK